jgi:hypothetical protein
VQYATIPVPVVTPVQMSAFRELQPHEVEFGSVAAGHTVVTAAGCATVRGSAAGLRDGALNPPREFSQKHAAFHVVERLRPVASSGDATAAANWASGAERAGAAGDRRHTCRLINLEHRTRIRL